MPKKIIHGGNIKGFAQRVGVPLESVIDFSSNINPLGISAAIKQAYVGSINEVAVYPDPCAEKLCAKISAMHHLDLENVMVGNGSISLIELVIRALRPKKALLIEPCFNEYRRLLELQGAEIIDIFLKAEDEFQFSIESIISHLEDIDMIVLGHPNNPTGTALSFNALEYLMQRAEKQNVYLVIDEAFVDWCPEYSVIELIQKYRTTIVIRSLTKFYALAGIRIGYACADKEIMDRMRPFQDTWSCNGVAQKLGLVALEDTAFKIETHQWFKEEHSYFLRVLSSVPTIKVFASLANFFLCKISDVKDQRCVMQGLEQARLYVREVHGFQGLDSCYFRIALKLRPENQYFLDQLKKIETLEKAMV